MASSQEAVIQELLFRLASVYIDRLTNTNSEPNPNPPHTPSRRRPLKNTDDLVQQLKLFAVYLFGSELIKIPLSQFKNHLLFSVVSVKKKIVYEQCDVNKSIHVNITLFTSKAGLLSACLHFRSTRAPIMVLCTRGYLCLVQPTLPALNTRRRSTNCR